MQTDQTTFSRVTVRSLTSADDLDRLAGELLADQADLINRLPTGGTILLKPTLLPDRNGTPRCHTPLLAALTRQLVNRGFDVVIGDSPSVLPDDNARLYRAAGLERMATLGARVVSFEQDGAAEIPLATRTFYIARAAINADLVLNLPVLHSADRQMRQGGLFNLLGLLPGYHKMTLVHQSPFAELLAGVVVDLNAMVSPGLSIMVVRQTDGSNRVISGSDTAAVDATVARAAGFAATAVPALRAAADAGLGLIHSESIDVRYLIAGQQQISVSRRRQSIAATLIRPLVNNLAAPFLSVRPEVCSDECDACGDCVSACPTGALRFEESRHEPQLKSGLCVGCFSCRACCHREAITTQQSPLYKRLPDSWRRFCVE